MSSIGSVLESRFKLKENKTNIQTEVLAGVTTFATMSYVLATIPNMLEQAGLVRGAILTALICAVVICSVAMALYTNRPFCLAPGMSSVAILSSVGSMNMTMEVAYGLIFIEGVIFVIISFAGLRQIIATAIPASIKISLSGGIGLYILIVTIIGVPLGVTTLPTSLLNLPSGIGDVSFRIDILGALRPEYLPWLLTFFVPDFFGTMGIILGVANQAGWLDKNGDMPGIEKCFKVDSLSTVAGSFFCMPVMTTYLESASGVEDGGRTGLTAIVTSILFALMLLFTPLAMMVPGVATGPVVTFIGFEMVGSM